MHNLIQIYPNKKSLNYNAIIVLGHKNIFLNAL